MHVTEQTLFAVSPQFTVCLLMSENCENLLIASKEAALLMLGVGRHRLPAC